MIELQENVIYFLVGIKTFEISAYVKTAFLQKNVNNFETLRQIFLSLSSFISASLKSIVTVELAAQMAGQT